MIPWVKLASTRTPDGTELSLWQRGDERVIRAGTLDLMSNRKYASEELLAEHGCAGLGERATVLIGGLGLGFTLRAALGALPASARVVVSELVPEVVVWLRDLLGGGALLDDPRVTVDERDCAVILRESTARFDAVLLDVDNGPAALTQAPNHWLYGREGLAAAAKSLRPRGRLAIWSSDDDPAFAERLARSGFEAQTIHARAHRIGTRGRGMRHAIFLGVRAG